MDPQQFQIYPSATEQNFVQSSFSPADPRTMDVVILSAEWSEKIGQCMPNVTSSAIFLTKLVLPSPGNHTATLDCQKWNHSMTHIVLLHPQLVTHQPQNPQNFNLNQIPPKFATKFFWTVWTA
jgi:hypothetical protein